MCNLKFTRMLLLAFLFCSTTTTFAQDNPPGDSIVYLGEIKNISVEWDVLVQNSDNTSLYFYIKNTSISPTTVFYHVTWRDSTGDPLTGDIEPWRRLDVGSGIAMQVNVSIPSTDVTNCDISLSDGSTFIK